MHHVHGGEKNDRQQNVHRWPGNSDQETVPARVIHELPRIVRALIHGVLAAHLDVAAKRDRIDSVVCLSPAEADQPLAEAYGKLLDPHSQPLGHRVVAKLVDQDHEAQNRNNGNERGQEIRHIRRYERSH